MGTFDLITSQEAARILEYNARTVYRLVRDGKLKPVRRLDPGPNGAFLFRLAEVEQLAKARVDARAKREQLANAADVARLARARARVERLTAKANAGAERLPISMPDVDGDKRKTA